jgi:transcriptional activator protein UGA3
MWLLHLHGAKALLKNIDAVALEEEPCRAMVDLYNYLCCVTSATTHDVPLPFERRSMPGDSKFYPLFGVAASLYKTFPLISQLKRMQTLSASIRELEQQAQEIELSLQCWTPHDEPASGTRMAEARAAAFATQWALMLWFKQATKKLPNDDPQITKAANNILSALSLIRPGSEIETRILFPLFMAGVGSVTKPNRLTVEYRLSRI